MMNFYYDPVLGLQYTYLGELFIIDIACLPQNYDLKEFMEKWKKYQSIQFLDVTNSCPPIEIVGQITNYML